MKHLFRILIAFGLLTAIALGQGAPPISPRPFVDNYAKIVALKGLVSPTVGAHLSMKNIIETNGGHTIVFDSAITYYDTVSVQQSIDVPDNTTLDLNGSTVWFYGNIPNAKGFNIVGDNVTIKNGKIYWTSLAGYSQTNGEYGDPISIGEYDSVGTDISGARILNINFKHDRNDNGTIAIFGQAHDILIDGCSADSLNSGALVLAHWGRPPSIASAPSSTNYTTHPYNITIRNCTVNRHVVVNSEMISLSGAYNVKVENCRLNYGKSFTQVYCGDFGYGYAKPQDQVAGVTLGYHTLMGQGISFENCWAYTTDADDAYNVVGKPDYAQTPALFDTVVWAMPVLFKNCYAIGDGGGGGANGWNIQNCRGVTIENCFATGMDATGTDGAAISIHENAWDTKIRGGLFEGNDYGVYAAYGTDSLRPRSVIIDGAHFRNNTSADVLAGFANGVIFGCTFGDTLVASTSPYAVNTTNKAYQINVIGNEVQSVTTTAFVINNVNSAVLFNNYVKSGVTATSGVTPMNYMGASGAAFTLPPGGVIQPSSSYMIFRAVNNVLRFQYNAGAGSVASFFGTDTVTDVMFTNDSALFRFASGAGGIKLYNSTTGSITLSGNVNGSDITYRLPATYGTAGQVLADSGTGGLYWTTGGGGGGTFTQIGSMTTNPAFAGTGADEDWIGLGQDSGRVQFEDGTNAADTVEIRDAVTAMYGTDDADRELIVGEGTVTIPRASSTTPLITFNQAGTNPIDVDAVSGIDAIADLTATTDHAYTSLSSQGVAKDVYQRFFTTSSWYHDYGIDISDSNRYKFSVHSSNYLDPDDSLDGDQASLAYGFQYQSRSHLWNGKMFDFRDTTGASQMQLKPSATSGWWILRNVDQIGDSTGYFKFINGAILPSGDTLASFNGEFVFNTPPLRYRGSPGDAIQSIPSFMGPTTNDSTERWILCADSSASADSLHDTLTFTFVAPHSFKLDTLYVVSSSNAANDSLTVDRFKGPKATFTTSAYPDSLYNASVIAKFHPTTNTAFTVNTRSVVTGATLVGSQDKLMPAGAYSLRFIVSLNTANSAVRIERVGIKWSRN